MINKNRSKQYRLEDDLLKKTRPKFGSGRYIRLEKAAAELSRCIKCEVCGKHLFNPLSILIHQGNGCQSKLNKK